jgi:type IV secretory pathway TrbL component
MTPQQMDDVRRTVEAKVRAGYDAGTRAIAKAGEAAGQVQADAGATVDKFKAGVRVEMDRAMGRRAPKPRPAAPRPIQSAPRPPSKRDAARTSGPG